MSPASAPDLSIATWRTSSYSNAQGGDCVQIAENFPGAAAWRKSTHSNAQGGACVEIADGLTGVVPVRDSKDPGRAPLVFGASAWMAFVSTVRDR